MENVTVEPFSLDSRVYVMYDPAKMSSETYDVRRMIGFLSLDGKSVNPACSLEEGCGDWPVKDCSTDSVVYLKGGVEEKIYNDGTCVVLSGSNLLKVENMFYYKLFGVI